MRIGTATDDSASDVLSLSLFISLALIFPRVFGVPFFFLSFSPLCVCFYVLAFVHRPLVDISPLVEWLDLPPLEGFIYLLKTFLIFRH